MLYEGSTNCFNNILIFWNRVCTTYSSVGQSVGIVYFLCNTGSDFQNRLVYPLFVASVDSRIQ